MNGRRSGGAGRRRVPLLALLAVVGACAGGDANRGRVLLVTTTSVEASGLLDELTAAYHASQDSFRLSTTAVGSGAALELGRRGDADVLLTHDPEGERRFMEEGLAAGQGAVMANEFVVVGPPPDPAGASGAPDVAAALRRIAGAGLRFVSRGDDSGTHTKERALWRAAGIEPWTDRPPWYVEAGTGMGEALQMADQLEAYALTDRGTYLNLRDQLDLVPLVEGDTSLVNPYSYTLPVTPINPAGARSFVRWLTGPGQHVIRQYGVPRFGEPLFRPTAARRRGLSARPGA